VAGWDALGLKASSVEAYYRMADFYNRMLRAVRSKLPDADAGTGFVDFRAMDGFPLLVQRHEKERVIQETRIRSIDKADPGPDRFQTPRTYRESEAPAWTVP
jgi:hypothetical protein